MVVVLVEGLRADLCVLADGKCIFDFRQSSSPSHVEFLNDYEAPMRALLSQCVKEDSPPCMFCFLLCVMRS